ncbi:hypothetical protein A374_14100 [Fictibacillus macauensis ZFHKF-1]|uniref:DUF4190 domain-containing protein n=1 Tax=Fictibacillus macauensis ZFHKF-1 TaxID=1196324 RepID=I8UD26_9BACL|nr:hypothetical protein [Fictibacillus macauensis]EIT84830.1 hypothetical protein A374_14100 [Fictibacillus macauensis ZFHKF-1]
MESQSQQASQGNGMAITSLILGIVGFVLGIWPFVGWFFLPAWILAIIFGAVGLKSNQSRGMALTGIILGILITLYKFGFWFIVALVS